jgi:hypothetical protein
VSETKGVAMTSWDAIRATVEEVWDGDRPNDAMLRFEIALDGERRQRMFLRREIVPPDLEWVLIDSPIGLCSQIDLSQAIAHAGQMIVGSLGYVPTSSPDGLLTFGARFPLPMMDPDASSMLLLLVQLLAQTTNTLEQQLVGTGWPYAT